MATKEANIWKFVFIFSKTEGKLLLTNFFAQILWQHFEKRVELIKEKAI